MLNLNDYYIGVILADPGYYKNIDRFKRRIKDTSYDPFSDVSFEQSIIIGTPVLLKKNDKYYYDVYNSLWENELYYEFGKKNEQGITLIHTKPFRDCYIDDPIIYNQEDLDNNPDMLLDILINKSYYISHSNVTNKEEILILDEEIMNIALYERLKILLGEDDYNSLINGKLSKK